MAWSNEAITKALKIAERFDRINTTDQICDILDAAAAVDGDAGWNAAVEEAAKKAEKSFHMEEFYPGCDVIISDDRDDIAAAIRSLKRLK
jgi:basic membrane lipoprotein Med (substrate-binding protein (PBP1-ABC) superfamily)